MLRSVFRSPKIQDTRQFLNILTVARCWNAFLVWCSYWISRIFRKPFQAGLPITVSIEPTTACNLRCPECPSGLRSFTRPTGSLEMERYRGWLDQLARTSCCLILYFQGEPFIHRSFLDLLKLARQYKLYTITSTNGHFLDDARARAVVESGLSRLVISIDGATQESYSAYRIGGDLETVQAGVRNVLKWKRRLQLPHPFVVVQFLVFRSNENQITEMRRWAQEEGVDCLQLKSAQLYEYQNGHHLMPDTDRYSRYRQTPDGTYRLKHSMVNHCWRLWHTTVITWDGRVLPCCFDKDARHQLGSLTTASFTEVWTGKASRKFRKLLIKGRNQIDICTNCTEGCKVRL